MRRKKQIFILTTIFFLLFSLTPTTTIQADTKEPMTEADLVDVIDQKNHHELTISYVLEDKKELILKTDVDKVIDLEALKKELGADKVTEDSEKKELKLALDNPDKIDFKVLVDNKKPFTLFALKSDGEEIFNSKFNEPEESQTRSDDVENDAEEASWTHSDKVRISKGPIMKHTDGSSTQPMIYFGDYNLNDSKTNTIESVWGIRGKSRINSLTAPNSGIIYAEPGSRISDGLRSNTNHIYTSHYGDSQNIDTEMPLTDYEDQAFGSPTSYTSNDLFNYAVSSDSKLRPGTAGPNKVGKAYAAIETPKFYYRTDQKTGFEEQRLVIKQRAFWENKKNRDNPVITTTIKQSFTKTGKVITNITYKNTGTVTFNKFIGFSNHDLSMNKDGAEIKDKGKKIGNYIPMRSLGNDRGMYIQTPNNEIRTSVYMNQPNEPGAWAARSASRSYLATKGYLYNPGLIGVIPIKETYYPWKVGKDKGGFLFPNSFYDRKKKQFNFPYTPDYTHNAFKNLNDLGDKGQMKGPGTRLGAEKEDESMWDAGLTMRTTPVDLEVGKSIQLEYATLTDVPGSTFNPVLEIDRPGSNETPNVFPLETDNLTITGHLYDFDSNHMTVYYGIDSDDEKDMKLFQYKKQSNAEANAGKIHEFTEKINVKGLEKGKHKIYFVAKDEDDNESHVEEYHFKFVKPASNAPQIDVTSPSTSKNDPHNPFKHNMDLTGYWTDKDSSQIKSITYKIDDKPEETFSENLNNPTPGALNPWKIEDLDIQEHNDFNKHLIRFKITDVDGNIGTDNFYFMHTPGKIQLVAPEEIDFGNVTVSPTSNDPRKPDMQDGKVLLEDYREENSNPIGVSLTIDKFYKAGKGNTDEDGDGDDSNENIDSSPEKREERESLAHDIYWKDQLVNGNTLRVAQTEGPKNGQWHQSTDLTKQVTDNLKINFRSGETGSPNGKYTSKWTWQTVDSLE